MLSETRPIESDRGLFVWLLLKSVHFHSAAVSTFFVHLVVFELGASGRARAREKSSGGDFFPEVPCGLLSFQMFFKLIQVSTHPCVPDSFDLYAALCTREHT